MASAAGTARHRKSAHAEYSPQPSVLARGGSDGRE